MSAVVKRAEPAFASLQQAIAAEKFCKEEKVEGTVVGDTALRGTSPPLFFQTLAEYGECTIS